MQRMERLTAPVPNGGSRIEGYMSIYGNKVPGERLTDAEARATPNKESEETDSSEEEKEV